MTNEENFRRSVFHTGFRTVWIVLLCLIVSSGSVVYAGKAAHISWDIVNADFSTVPATISAGGTASARANDDSKIELTGSGTFVAPASDRGMSSAVTGGGTWQTFDPDDNPTGEGTYRVIALVQWLEAPGALPPGFGPDLIDPTKPRLPGLAVLRIEYSDGSQGILIISCHFGGTPDSVFEGVTATKGFVDYWNREPAEVPVNANFTTFHDLR
jgi:hypothetical protein